MIARVKNKDWIKRKNPPVDADGAEVEDTGGAHHDVQGEQDVAVDEAEAPFSHHLQQNKHNMSFTLIF